MSVNGEFSEYYNQTFERVGMVFQSAYNVMRLKSAGKIIDCVLSLRAPQYTGTGYMASCLFQLPGVP